MTYPVTRRSFRAVLPAAAVAFVALVLAQGCSSSEVELCGDGVASVLDGITGSPAYDSIEKRVAGQILAQVGSPCSSAKDDACQKQYDAVVASASNNVLVVTRGDSVDVHTKVTMALLGGTIDTAAEAGLWVLDIPNTGGQCGSAYELVAKPAEGSGFDVTRAAAYPGDRCIRTTIHVEPDGTKTRTSGDEECPSGVSLPGGNTPFDPPETF